SLVGPEELARGHLVGDEIFDRIPVRAGVEDDDREAGFGEFRTDDAAARARADDAEVHFFTRQVAHRHGLAVNTGSRERPISIRLAHPLLALNLSLRLKKNPIVRPARPAPATASRLRFIDAQSCGLDALARSSKRPCAPWSPGKGSHRLSRRPGSTGSSVCCASYPFFAR